MINKLAKAIKGGKVLLFVGAGVSMSLGLPSWSQLIEKIAEDLGYAPEVFNSLGDYLTLSEYYESEKGKIGPLRSWMDRIWHHSDIDIRTSKIHQLIVELDFPSIYTTNYDRWIEYAFEAYEKSYVKIAHVRDLLNIEEGVPQIVKFHGDLDDDESIVLTEKSYFERLDFETPLDIKLRSELLGKSVLFIGYSLADINIRYLIYKLNKLWINSNCFESMPQSYLFLAKPNPIQEEVLRKRGITTFVSEKDDAKEGLELFLQQLFQLVKSL